MSTDTPAQPVPAQHVPARPVEVRRKRLSFRSWHRGTREADLIMGRFADRYVREMTEEQLDRYERLLELSDPDLYNWMTGREPVPAEHDSDVMRMLIGYTCPAPHTPPERPD
ncbi:MAG TPA: succinate dehydrogenase assembly factor 2 [Arenibaculum sp.]|nr:succinate dehydrogenase assembly factor 2 [Arenibaculum sp.]